MMMMKSVFWWRKPEYPEETTDLWQVTDETVHTYDLCPVGGLQISVYLQLTIVMMWISIICASDPWSLVIWRIDQR